MSSEARARQSEQAVRHRSSTAIHVADGLQVVHFSGPSQCGQASRPPRPLRRAAQRRLRRSVDGHGVPSSRPAVEPDLPRGFIPPHVLAWRRPPQRSGRSPSTVTGGRDEIR